MSDPAKRRATYQDVIDAPEHMVAEIIHGELVLSPRPASLHTHAASMLGGELHGFSRGRGGPGGWVLLVEPELHLLGHVLVPDLGGWRRERLTPFPDGPYFETEPDWVCEVLSPSTSKRDRIDKLAIYAEAGVSHAWLIDPPLRTLEVYRREGKRWLLLGSYADDARVRAEPFEALELELDLLWPPGSP